MRAALRLAAAAVLLVGLGCTVPSEQTASVIDPTELPDQLRTDIPPSTTAAPVESPSAVPITLYVIAPLTERHVVAPIQREIDPRADLFMRLSLMFVSDLFVENDAEAEYQNALASLELTRAEANEGGIAVIDIVQRDVDGEVVALDNDALRDAAAQLVYTATSFEEIDRVRLLYDGERRILPTQGTEGDTDRLLTTADYPLYDPESEIETLETLPEAPEPEPLPEPEPEPEPTDDAPPNDDGSAPEDDPAADEGSAEADDV